jgi:hypothetical protein
VRANLSDRLIGQDGNQSLDSNQGQHHLKSRLVNRVTAGFLTKAVQFLSYFLGLSFPYHWRIQCEWINGTQYQNPRPCGHGSPLMAYYWRSF